MKINAFVVACVVAAGSVSPAAAMFAAAPLPLPQGRPLSPVIVDAGHGGHDLGAVVHGTYEKDIALAVARKVRDRLKGRVPVVMTRDDDSFVTLDRRVVESLDADAALFVSIHLNKVRDPRMAGATVYSYGPDRNRVHPHRRRRRHFVPPMPAPPRVDSREGADLAREIAAGLRGAGVSVERRRQNYYVLKNPGAPSVLVELGYLSNPAEAARLKDPAYQDRLAGALAGAIARYDAGRADRAETASR
jgi:N-acetylmuramoyl-L-alanine amidase